MLVFIPKDVNVEHLKAYSKLLKMPVTSFLPDAISLVQISHGEGHNINSIVNYHHNTIDKQPKDNHRIFRESGQWFKIRIIS